MKDAPLVAPCPRCRALSWFGLLCGRCDRVAVRVRDAAGERTVYVPRVRPAK